MDGTTWNSEEVKELRRLRLDTIRNPPGKLRPLVEHFLKPGSSVFAVTEGDGAVRVSKALARKVRDLTLEGALGWVVEDAVRKDGEDHLGEPWAALLWRYPAEFAAAVAAYQGELEFEVQAKEIASGDRVAFTRQATRYGPDHKPFVEAIFNREAGLRDLRRGHRVALDSDDAATARSTSQQIGESLDGWVIDEELEYSTAADPARSPDTTEYKSIFPFKDPAPWKPEFEHSPAAYKPGIDVAPSSSVAIPPRIRFIAGATGIESLDKSAFRSIPSRALVIKKVEETSSVLKPVFRRR